MRPQYERTAADLRFYFRDADGAMGLRSNFQAMVSSLEGGGWTPKPTHEVGDHRMEAARRCREIHDVLELIPVWARVVLGVCYRSPDGQALFLGATSLAVDYHRRSKTKRYLWDWAERCRLSSDQRRNRLWVEMRQNADAILEEAMDEYERVAVVLSRRGASRGAGTLAG